jgi:hypothetical protein
LLVILDDATSEICDQPSEQESSIAMRRALQEEIVQHGIF